MKTTPYIGRQVSHFEKVDVANINATFSEDNTYRYSLSLPFHPEVARTKTAAVILKNPSSADAKRGDKTVQNVAKVIYKSFPDVGRVEILNMFAIRGTLPSDVMVAHNAGNDIVGPQNDPTLIEVLTRSDYVVTAWGGASPIRKSIYDKRIDEVHALIAGAGSLSGGFRKAEKGSERYPFHACYWPDSVSFVALD